MRIELTRIDPAGPDAAGLVDFFTSEDFPFHVYQAAWSDGMVRERIDSGYFHDEENESFWLDHHRFGRVGFTRLEDIHDETVMVDLRLASRFRGRGLGNEVVNAITDHLFSATGALRAEGQTRDDNQPMRTVFERAGWTKEAHYRRAWPVNGAAPRDSVAYALLREEWLTGRRVPLHWHDGRRFRESADSAITYSSNALPPQEALMVLYDSVGWSAYTADPARLDRSIRASAHVVSAWIGDSLVGLARVLSDFDTVVYVQDVLVDPEHRRQGIGAGLMQRVLEPFADVRQTVLLTDDEAGLAAFYVSLGFSEASVTAGSSLRAFVRM
ncbi:GNAT family N-acetyltransferase [Brevibacterium atlanticum]|uniref:GNAT family N-acetyltransferase n=1 Tax=Brevibacterium atlanticum TaxID=2697563 RepID=UPI001D1814D3|nr:GNAT family N-acetyltransferase [Brevibacterium atlanticum]